ncbi:hypothetical protein LCGC14_3021850 [marine sediment metagenome]|uniref:Uncharacterized protein n=1 Tax=marine sediment metagenome TaxID=412755 RepID=A0A0F8Z2L2_9ZZZZ
MTDKLYFVSHDMQAKEINKYCFRECGKILIGGVEMAGLAFLPCNIDDCSFLEKQIKSESITFDGVIYNDVYIRKLKAMEN